MPRIIRQRVYFTIAEAANRVSVPVGTMRRWAWEGEKKINDIAEVYRDGKQLFISQSSLKRLIAREAREAAQAGNTVGSGHPTPQGRDSREARLVSSCFISFSTKDLEFANRLYIDLQDSGIRCRYAPHHARGGIRLNEQIDEAVKLHDRLLLILSDHSMNSEWVKTEIAHARKKEAIEGRPVLFPISLVSFERIREWRWFDADAGKDSAREIREYFIPDFSNWKDDHSYRQAFQRLVTDLKAEKNGPGATRRG
jgi:hypothetical protein